MKKKILFVDDDQDLLELIGDRLRSNGYEVVTAKDGGQGLAAAKKHRPDLIILDIMMPGISGVEMGRELKADPKTADIPVIFLTALKAKSDDLPDAQGPNIVLAKPITTQALIDKIEWVLKGV